VGEREITDHQRLSGLGYCFSAALPPYLATAAMGSIDILDSHAGKALLTKTQENARHLRSSLASLEGGLLCGSQNSEVSRLGATDAASSTRTLWKRSLSCGDPSPAFESCSQL